MGGQVSQESVANVTSSVVSTIIVNAALFCNTESLSEQMTRITCNPSVTVPNGVYEDGAGCQLCLQNIKDNAENYYKTVRTTWETEGATIKKSIDEDYTQIIQSFISCANVCKACVIEDISQKTMITDSVNCQATNNIRNSITQKLSAAINQKLENNQDVFSGLAEMLGASTRNQVVTNLTNRVSSLLTDNIIQNARSQINTIQNIDLTVSSVVVKGTTQDSAINSVQTFFAKNKIFNNVISKAEADVAQNVVNSQNTIDTLGNTVVKSVGTLARLTNSVFGKIVIFLYSLLGVLLIGMIVFISVKLIRKKVKEDQEKDDTQLTKLKTSGNTIFNAF